MFRRVATGLKGQSLSNNYFGTNFRNLQRLKNCANVEPNLTFSLSRKLHFSSKNRHKIFIDVENTYAYKFLPPQLAKIKPVWQPQNKITSLEELEQFLDRNWRASSATSIVEAFEKIKDFLVSHNIDLSDKRLDGLVDGLMDHCEKLTDGELLKLLLLLVEYPPSESSSSHNFHDVWSCLDDICCWKMGSWDLETMYVFADAFYRWNLGRLSDYVFEVLDKATFKPHRLSKNMLLYTFFYLNVCRKKGVPFEFEHVLAERINELDTNELTLIAMGYFKTRSKVKLVPILSAMIRTIEENCETINEISLAAMLKAIRLSQQIGTVPEIRRMLDKLTAQIPRLSIMSLVHVALIGTSLQLRHEESLIKSTERIVTDIKNVRLKDIERMLLACSMFDVETSPSFFEKAFEELHTEERRKEFVQYNRCLASALNYLSLRGKYSYELTNEVLNEEFINETYGKSSKNLPRELFSLDACVDIECPDYKGSRLTPFKRYKAAKWQSEYPPTLEWKRPSLSDKYYLDVVEHVRNVVGDESLLRNDHVLPHFSKSDIILCRNRITAEFVEPFGFENYILGDIKRPFELEKYQWYALVVMTPNLMARDEHSPLGTMIMKERQLRRIGYTPILVYWNEFSPLPSPQKTAFLSRHLRR